MDERKEINIDSTQNTEISFKLNRVLGIAAASGYCACIADLYKNDEEFRLAIDDFVEQYKGIYDDNDRLVHSISVSDISNQMFPRLLQAVKDSPDLQKVILDAFNQKLRDINVTDIQTTTVIILEYLEDGIPPSVQRSAMHNFIAYGLGVMFSRDELNQRFHFFTKKREAELTIKERIFQYNRGGLKYSHDQIEAIVAIISQNVSTLSMGEIPFDDVLGDDRFQNRTLDSLKNHYLTYQEYYRQAISDIVGFEIPIYSKSPKSEWSIEELTILFSHSKYKYEELAEMLPGRKPSEISNKVDRFRKREFKLFQIDGIDEPLEFIGFEPNWEAIPRNAALNGTQQREFAMLLTTSEGITAEETQKRFGIGESTARNLLGQLKRRGFINEDVTFAPAERNWTEDDESVLTSILIQNPDKTVVQIFSMFNGIEGVRRRSFRGIEERLRKIKSQLEQY